MGFQEVLTGVATGAAVKTAGKILKTGVDLGYNAAKSVDVHLNVGDLTRALNAAGENTANEYTGEKLLFFKYTNSVGYARLLSLLSTGGGAQVEQINSAMNALNDACAEYGKIELRKQVEKTGLVRLPLALNVIKPNEFIVTNGFLPGRCGTFRVFETPQGQPGSWSIANLRGNFPVRFSSMQDALKTVSDLEDGLAMFHRKAFVLGADFQNTPFVTSRENPALVTNVVEGGLVSTKNITGLRTLDGETLAQLANQQFRLLSAEIPTTVTKPKAPPEDEAPAIASNDVPTDSETVGAAGASAPEETPTDDEPTGTSASGAPTEKAVDPDAISSEDGFKEKLAQKFDNYCKVEDVTGGRRVTISLSRSDDIKYSRIHDFVNGSANSPIKLGEGADADPSKWMLKVGDTDYTWGKDGNGTDTWVDGAGARLLVNRGETTFTIAKKPAEDPPPTKAEVIRAAGTIEVTDIRKNLDDFFKSEDYQSWEAKFNELASKRGELVRLNDEKITLKDSVSRFDSLRGKPLQNLVLRKQHEDNLKRLAVLDKLIPGVQAQMKVLSREATKLETKIEPKAKELVAQVSDKEAFKDDMSKLLKITKTKPAPVKAVVKVGAPGRVESGAAANVKTKVKIGLVPPA
ncbi:MAG: hypothetical protein WC846_03555 [Candidatus Gracilibacteria bacterium]|jgi:hypothetical protein